MRKPVITPVSFRRLSKYIAMPLGCIEDDYDGRYVKTLIDCIPEVKLVRKLTFMFKRILKENCGNIHRWITFIRKSNYKLAGVKKFANGLLRDIDAVERDKNEME